MVSSEIKKQVNKDFGNLIGNTKIPEWEVYANAFLIRSFY